MVDTGNSGAYANLEGHDVRVLGIDFGGVRIGLSVSDPTGTLARPLCTMTPDGSLEERAASIGAEATRMATEPDGLDAIVVGVPRSLDGTAHQQTECVLAFVEALRTSTSLPVELQDERLTTVEAEQRLAVREPNWRKRKARLDAASAAVILQDYLDRNPRQGLGEEPGSGTGDRGPGEVG